jgi:alpha-beta hydrolase superfamily lysophospholipase
MTTLPFDPARLRRDLPPFSLERPRLFSADERAYLEFYDIDFAGEIDGVDHYFGRIDDPPHRLSIHCWRPRRPVGQFFVLHGYFDHIGIYRHLIRFLLERHFVVVGFDLPGHGLSSGDPAHIDSFDEYVTSFDRCLCVIGPERRGLPWHIVGQSTGAAIAMEWALTNGYMKANAPFESMVLLAPLVRPARWPIVRVGYHFGRHFVERQARMFNQNSDDAEFLRFLRELDPLQAKSLPIAWVTAMVHWMRRFRRHSPTDLAPLVIQGQRDGTVDWRFNVKEIGRLFDADIVYVPEARHHLVNESTPIRSRVFAAIEAHLRAGTLATA